LISRRSLLTQLGLLAAAGGGAWWVRDHVLWPAPSLVFADGRSSGWLDFARPEAGVPIVAASVNGQRVEALLDSGAQSSVIDHGLAERLGLAASALAPVIIAFGVSGSPQLGRTAAMDVKLAGLTLGGLRAAVFQLAPIAAASGRSFGLILGQDVLKLLVADLDFPGLRLAFHAPGSFEPPPGSRAVRVRTTGRELFAPILVEGAALEAVIDTGSTAALALSAETAQAAGLLTGRRIGWAPSITFGGAGRDRVVRVDTLGFAGQVYRNVPVHIYARNGAAPLPPGLIGVEALDRFRAILEVGGGRLRLAPADSES
jgi:predicted aspartyl protease